MGPQAPNYPSVPTQSLIHSFTHTPNHPFTHSLIHSFTLYYWVAYDIGNNRTRRLAAKWCKQAGLLRLQRSVFTGRSDAARMRELETNLKPLLGSKDRFCILPIDKAAWKNLLLLGNNPSLQQLDRSEPFKYF